ncbi:MAG: dTDP-4-dehydrorhamnose reductase [Akkermansia sp.]|nr:dTDP-4-dehydrorhamnose reductase [Akkermansia sp.]
MNVLVTGANGQLGNEMRRIAASGATPHRYIFTDVAELDITDPAAIGAMLGAEQVDAIVNCAAYTNVDKAEEDAATADLINNKAVANLAAAAKARNALLVHVSTDYVFGGDGNLPRREDDAVNPLGVYGATKLAGEQAIAAAGCRSVILRTAWLYSVHGKNFVKTMLNLMATRPELKVVFDQVGTPTYAGDLADAIAVILCDPQVNGKLGTYHFSDEGVCSWFDFSTAIAELSGSACVVKPCHSDEFPSKVTRPAFSVLDKTKIKQAFGLCIPHWRTSLVLCLNALKNA